MEEVKLNKRKWLMRRRNAIQSQLIDLWHEYRCREHFEHEYACSDDWICEHSPPDIAAKYERLTELLLSTDRSIDGGFKRHALTLFNDK